jgi:hypothetical protein
MIAAVAGSTAARPPVSDTGLGATGAVVADALRHKSIHGTLSTSPDSAIGVSTPPREPGQ